MTLVDSAKPAAWSEADLAAFSRECIEQGSKSFAAAARLFAPDVRTSAMMLYAWCRHCDDVIDGQEFGHNTPAASQTVSDERLAELRANTIEALQGRATEPVFLALAAVTARHQIPRRYPLDLIEGMAMDVRGFPARTLDDTLLYCYHVAGCVGVMMAYTMGASARPALERACDLGAAFQLTNIARDVLADARVGRVYLPEDWLADAGIPRDRVANPEHREALFGVTVRLLDEAERYYASAYYGLAMLPARSALAIAAARRIYRAIGARIRAGGPQGMERRAVVSRGRKRTALVAALGDVAMAKSSTRLIPPPRIGLWTLPG